MQKAAKRNVVIPAPLLDIIAVCLAEAGAIARHPLTGTVMRGKIEADAALAAAKEAVEKAWGVTVVTAGHRSDRTVKAKNGRKRRWQKKRPSA